MSVTATYTYPSAATHQWFGLAEVNGTLYASVDATAIYSVNKSTGAISAIYSEARDWRVISAVNGNLLCTQYNAALKLISPSGVLLKNFGNDLWFGACADSSDTNVAYGACFNKSTNQFAKLNISAGTVQYYTVANRAYCGIVNVGQYIYAVVNNGLIYKIDKTTFAETVFCSESRAWIDLTFDGQYLYSVVHGGQVRRIDLATGVSEIILGDPAGNTTNRNWQTLTYSPTDKAIWAGIFAWELWKLALPVPAVPTASVPSSTIYNDTSVTLSCSTSGAVIKYTLDGSTPSSSNGTTYSGAITINKTTTLKFCAIKDGYVTAGVDVIYVFGLNKLIDVEYSTLTQYAIDTTKSSEENLMMNGSTLCRISRDFVVDLHSYNSNYLYKWNGSGWDTPHIFHDQLGWQSRSFTQYPSVGNSFIAANTAAGGYGATLMNIDGTTEFTWSSTPVYCFGAGANSNKAYGLGSNGLTIFSGTNSSNKTLTTIAVTNLSSYSAGRGMYLAGYLYVYGRVTGSVYNQLVRIDVSTGVASAVTRLSNVPLSFQTDDKYIYIVYLDRIEVVSLDNTNPNAVVSSVVINSLPSGDESICSFVISNGVSYLLTKNQTTQMYTIYSATMSQIDITTKFANTGSRWEPVNNKFVYDNAQWKAASSIHKMISGTWTQIL